MNPKLELTMIVAVITLVCSTAPPLALVPRRIKWTHWLIVGIYALVGVEGFRFLIVYCVNHSKFVALFSQPNIANLSPGSMQVTALAYSLTSLLFCLAALRLGRLRKWAGTVFSWLALPVSALYPMIMATAFLPSAPAFTVQWATYLLLLASLLSILFYRSPG